MHLILNYFFFAKYVNQLSSDLQPIECRVIATVGLESLGLRAIGLCSPHNDVIMQNLAQRRL